MYFQMMKTNSISLFIAFQLGLISFLHADETRNQASVERMIVGSWSVVNLVIDPGKPFVGSKEEKEFMDMLWEMRIQDALGSTVFSFNTDKTYTIQTPKGDKIKTMKGNWRLEENGDILVFKEKNKDPDRMKILLVDEKDLELLINDGDSYMLVFKRKP
jgi:hypothetical protein